MKINLKNLEKVINPELQDLNTQKLNEIHESTITEKNPKGFSYDDIIRMTAAKFTCWCVDFDDIYNELILFFLDIIKKYSDTGEMSDGWDNYNYGLNDPVKFTFKIIKNKAIDIYRKYRKEWDSKLDYFDELSYEGNDVDSVSSHIGLPEDDAYLNVLQLQFRDSYPVMSRPWIYVTLKFAAAGIIPESELIPYNLHIPHRSTSSGPQTDIRDVDIIAQMGFKGTKPSSYYAMKAEIKEELIRFLNGQSMFEL